ncbi:MAG: hypothetical protein HY673_01650 [Chloroflexi bacterium]|nr:hypothetical protein [Chloroflexota bacterium]
MFSKVMLNIPNLWNWGGAIVLTFLLHYAWEMGQAPLFTNFTDVSFFDHALRCLGAAFGDLVITSVAYGVTAVVFRRSSWALQQSWLFPAGIWIGLGIGLTILIEYWALSGGRWAYTAAMPRIFGIGLTPLIQWVAIPATTLAIFRWIALRPIKR